MSKRTRELAAARREANKPLEMRRKLLLGVGATALFGSLVYGFHAVISMPVSHDEELPWEPGKTSFGTDIVMGSESAPVTVVEYASLTCVHCARFHNESLPEFLKGWVDGGKAKLIYRHLPLDASALAGANFVSCLPPEDRAAAVSVMMRNRDRWASASDPAAAALDLMTLPRRAVTLARQCSAKNGQQETLMNSVTEARNGGISSTPTFVIGRKAYKGFMSSEVLGALVDAAAKS